MQYHKFPEALGLAIRLGDRELVRQDFNAPANPYVLIISGGVDGLIFM
jgi:hypothetical protein